jgi:RimJ/RimL family protein N-acetyltransferase
MDGRLADRPGVGDGRPRASRVLARVRSLFWQLDEYRVYRYRLAELEPPASARNCPVRRDHAPDLELYVPTPPWFLPKETFLAVARARLAAGDHVYTIVAGERLMHYAWLADCRDTTLVQEVDQTLHYAIPGAVLYDAYTRPDARGRGLHTRSMTARLRDAQALAGARWAYVGCLAGNRPSRGVIERAGFAYYTSLFRMQALGLASRWQSTARA